MPCSTAPGGRLGDRVLRYLPGHSLEGDDVAHLQARLAELGFSPGKIDGIHGPAHGRRPAPLPGGGGADADGTLGPETMRAFAALRRSVTGGSAIALQEREQIRRGGYSLSGRTIVLDPGHGGDDPGTTRFGLSSPTSPSTSRTASRVGCPPTA